MVNTQKIWCRLGRGKSRRRGKKRSRNKTRSRGMGRGFTSRNYTRKATELRKLDLDRDIEKEFLGLVKRDSAATMLQKNVGNYSDKRKVRRLLRDLLEHESDDPDTLHFEMDDDNLREILGDVTASMRFTIRDRKNQAWIRILGKIYNGLNEFVSERNSPIYKDIVRAFKILVHKLLDIEIDEANDNAFLESEDLYNLLIEPLIARNRLAWPVG